MNSPGTGAHRVPARAARSRPPRGRHARPRPGRKVVRAAFLPLVLAPALLVAGTAAHAWWTGSGVGSAEVGAATAVALVVTATVPSDLLHPGRTVDVGFSVANPNAYPVSLTELMAVTVTSSAEGSCPGATYAVLPAEVVSAMASGGHSLVSPILVPPGATATPASLAGLVTLSTSAPDACQGVQFTLALAFTGAQA